MRIVFIPTVTGIQLYLKCSIDAAAADISAEVTLDLLHSEHGRSSCCGEALPCDAVSVCRAALRFSSRGSR